MKGLFSINSPFWEMTDRLLRLLWLSILWAVCSIPIVTMGASTTALYSITLKYVRGEEGYLTSSFFRAFRANFKQATVIWAVFLAAGLFLFADFAVYYRGGVEHPFSLILFTVFMGILAAYIFANIYVYPLLAHFDNTIRRTICNSLLMALCHLPSSIAMAVFSFAVTAVGFTLFPPLLLAAPGITAYFHSRFLRNIFDQYIEKEPLCTSLT